MRKSDDSVGASETDHLLRREANARRLRRSIRQAEAGKLEEHEIVDVPPNPASRPGD